MNLTADLKAMTEGVRQQVPAEVFATMEAATAKLATTDLGAQTLQVGQTMADFELPDATGTLVRSADLRAQGLLLISFYRGHWCPYCNLELQALQAHLDDINALGATLVAISPQTPDQSLTTMEQSGVAFLDAPVVGSRPQAEAGKLSYLVGGRAETLAQVEDILLAAGGAAVHHVGPVGHGMALKLAVNALFGIQVAALAEILSLLAKLGLSNDSALAILGEMPVLSPATRLAGNLMIANNHAPLFPIGLVEKDFRYVLETAQAVGATTPTAAAIHALYQAVIAQGYGEDNITGIAQLQH